MSAKENKVLVRQYFKEFNQATGNPDKIHSVCQKYYAPSFTFHAPSRDMTREQIIRHLTTKEMPFPDATYSIEDMLAEGDKVAVRYTMQGAHKEPLRGIPATGKKVLIKGVAIQKIDDGMLQEEWVFEDVLGAMTQLGAIPSAAPKK